MIATAFGSGTDLTTSIAEASCCSVRAPASVQWGTQFAGR